MVKYQKWTILIILQLFSSLDFWTTRHCILLLSSGSQTVVRGKLYGGTQTYTTELDISSLMLNPQIYDSQWKFVIKTSQIYKNQFTFIDKLKSNYIVAF